MRHGTSRFRPNCGRCPDSCDVWEKRLAVLWAGGAGGGGGRRKMNGIKAAHAHMLACALFRSLHTHTHTHTHTGRRLSTGQPGPKFNYIDFRRLVAHGESKTRLWYVYGSTPPFDALQQTVVSCSENSWNLNVLTTWHHTTDASNNPLLLFASLCSSVFDLFVGINTYIHT